MSVEPATEASWPQVLQGRGLYGANNQQQSFSLSFMKTP